MKKLPGIFVGAGAVSLVFLPVYVSSYWKTFLFTLLVNISLTGGINLLWGFAGYLNLGYMAFFGLGAYGAAILLLKGYSFWVSLLISQVAFLTVGGVLAWALFRLQGFYVSAASLGILFLLEESAGKISFLSGGQDGLSLPLGHHSLEGYWLSLSLACVSLGANRLLSRTRLGFRLRMIREDERVAESTGIPLLSSKVTAYVLGVSIALLAGGITVQQTGYISPASAFGLSVAMPPVIMALIGGGEKWWRPLLGAILITGIQEILWTELDRWVLSGYGFILILIGMCRAGEDQWTRLRRALLGKWRRLP